MLSSKFIKFMRALKSGKTENLDQILGLGRVGLRLAEEYSTRFDLLEIDQCFTLSQFKPLERGKAEKHLLHLVQKYDPLFSLMEYYDNYPYSYSDINYFFKGTLKSGVEISIKAVNPVAKNNYFKKLNKLKKSLKRHSFFMPWMNSKFLAKEILNDLEKHSHEKFSFVNELRFSKTMQEYVEMYRDYDFMQRVEFPSLYSYLSSQDIVVSKYVCGEYFYELLETRSLKYKDVLVLIKIQLFFILKVGVFHNNLHSGNLVLDDDGRIHFLDCNTITILRTKTRDLLFSILKSYAHKNFGELVYSLHELSILKISEDGLEKLVEDIRLASRPRVSIKNSFIKQLMVIFNLACEHGLVFDKDIFSTFKSFLYLEKLVLKTKKKTDMVLSDFSKILTELDTIKR